MTEMTDMIVESAYFMAGEVTLAIVPSDDNTIAEMEANGWKRITKQQYEALEARAWGAYSDWCYATADD